MEDISLHILDVAENGIRAGASLVQISIREDVASDELVVTIQDNGRGMEPDFLKNVLDPFVTTRTTRKVGLGLSLFQQSAMEADGDLVIESKVGLGTTVKARMRHGHIDRKPLGNMVETMLTLIEGNPNVDFVYTHVKNGKGYVLDTRTLRQELEEVPINSPAVIELIKQDLLTGLQEIQ
jgi:anti-sigma regulatory factor (Ser/Thr protein kinase)|uniref:histidine kinase n=1 Tax=Desulfomonile tiedjei TaxID=2358 RepID=A0A7C4ET50_9BACT